VLAISEPNLTSLAGFSDEGQDAAQGTGQGAGQDTGHGTGTAA
jgi:hypothetical protein